MADPGRDREAREALAAALAARGVADPGEFRRRYGVPPGALTVSAALALVDTPAWVAECWLPHAGPTAVVYIPRAVRAYAGALGLAQGAGETEHAFNARLRAAVRAMAGENARELRPAGTEEGRA